MENQRRQSQEKLISPEYPDQPSEFRYWQRCDQPWVRVCRHLVRAVVGTDPLPNKSQMKRFAASYFDGDAVAEAFVVEVVDVLGYPAARQLLDRALKSGTDSIDDAPASLVQLFEDIEVPPDWVDWQKLELGAKVFRRFGSSVFEFAGAATLQSYAESSVAKALTLSGGYKGSATRRRFLETSSFWIDVSNLGGMQPGGKGLAAAMAVRVMHVFVRRRLQQHPEWNTQAWGVPISQGDALLTLMGGSVAPGIAMYALGYRCSIAEIEAMMHFWRYVGHVMGVRPRWYPTTVQEGVSLLLANSLKGSMSAGEDGEVLCRSFASAFAPKKDLPIGAQLRAKWQQGVHLGYLRFFTPPGSFPSKSVPSTGFWPLYPLLRFPYIFVAESLRRRFPRLDKVADKRAMRERERWQQQMQGQFSSRFRPNAKGP